MSTIHNFTKNVSGWGHNTTNFKTNDSGVTATISGWQRGIEPGDFLVIEGRNQASLYTVDDIRYEADPTDQFQASLSHRPDISPEEIQKIEKMLEDQTLSVEAG